MKSALSVLLIFLLYAVPARGAAPLECVIGVSPFLENSVKDDLFRRTIGLVLEEMPLGSSIAIYDAWSLQTVCEMKIPENSAFRSGKTRANQFKAQIAQFRRFLAASPVRPVSGKLDFTAALRVPQFLDFAAANGLRTNAVILLAGSPLYLDPKEPAFSMADGYFPNDAHLIASREKSVYGTLEHRGELHGVAVHFVWFGDPWVSDLHHENIERFWSLYFAELGGRLGVFTGDLAGAFKAITSSQSGPKPFVLNRTGTKLEMLRITRDVSLADWITRDLSAAPDSPAPSRTAGPMKIGIRWSGKIDLDLYASAKPGAQTLFFEHTRTPEGYYFKDHRSSPEHEYEFIDFESPVSIFEVEAKVNFFEGRAPAGAQGEVRIEFDGRIYTGQFRISAPQGNEGRTGPHQHDFWTRLDIPKILKVSRLSAESEKQGARL